MENIDVLIHCVLKLGGSDLAVADAPNTVNFTLQEIGAFAYVSAGGGLRGSVFLDPSVPADEMDEAIEWAAQQSPTGCRVDAGWFSDSDEDGGFIRLLFERDLDPELIAEDDPLAAEAEALFRSWYGEEESEPSPAPRPMQARNPTRRAPTSAWLLLGNEDSFPTRELMEEISRDAKLGIYENSWTAAKQTEPGDLLFFYFAAPHKAIHFVARAAGHAYFEDSGENEEKWSSRQWWTHISPMVQIKPIPLSQLQQVTGDAVMRGRSGRYLRPEHAGPLAKAALALRTEDTQLLAQILKPVQGRADHPDPALLDLSQWRQLTAGSFRLEADVERLIVEPLLRLALADQPGLAVAKAYRVGAQIIDYVVLQGGRPICAIEVKLRVRRNPATPWLHCKDFQQAAGYAETLGVPAILIDAFHTYLIPNQAEEPTLTITRTAFLDEDLATLRSHILGN